MRTKLTSGFVGSLTILSVPIMILNLLGGIISGIWLAILGEWGEIGSGIILSFLSAFLIPVALIPGMIFAVPSAIAISKGRRIIGSFLGFLSILYTVVLITIWCIWIMWIFVKSENSSALIPLLIWSYGVAITPWMWLTRKDQEGGSGNSYSVFTTLFAQVAYIVGIVMFLTGATLGSIALIFSIIMIVNALLQTAILFFMSSQHNYYE
jgi:hypothetical protein